MSKPKPKKTEVKPESDFLTQKQVAAFFDVNPITVSRWTVSGVIPHHRIGRILRYKMSDILNSSFKPSK